MATLAWPCSDFRGKHAHGKRGTWHPRRYTELETALAQFREIITICPPHFPHSTSSPAVLLPTNGDALVAATFFPLACEHGAYNEDRPIALADGNHYLLRRLDERARCDASRRVFL
jgi:hypothetical protein